MATSFSTSGATPTLLPPSSQAQGFLSNPTNTPPIPFTGVSQTAATPPSNQTIAGLLTSALVKPSTPLKSITAGADGSVSTAYHAPAAPFSSPTTDPVTSGANAQTPQQIAATTGQNIAPAPTGTNTTATGNQTPYSTSNPPTSLPGLLGSSLGQAQGYFNQQTGLTGQAEDLINKYSGLMGGLVDSPLAGGGSGIGSAKLAQLGSLENTGLANIGSQQATLSGFEQPLTSAYNTAIGASQPQVAGYGQTSFNPLTNSYGSSGGSGIQPTDPAYPTLQQYASLAAAGEGSQIPSSWTSNPVINAQINSMAQQINPNYNPLTTSLNTTTQANTNAQIGSTNQTAAAATQQAISRVSNVTSNLSQFLTQWGLNQTNSPYFNQPMNTFISSGPGAGSAASWKLITSDLTAATAQLLNTPGITPTGFTSELQSFDPSNLSPQEIQTYLQALNVAGQYQINSYQTTSSAAYGSNTGSNSTSPVTPYAGTPTSNTPPPLPAPANPAAVQAQNAPTAGKVLGGALLDAWGGITSALSGFGSFLSSL